jgi:hypothetical protein
MFKQQTSFSFLMVACLLLSFRCSDRWRSADEFQSQLKCGMTVAEVEKLAADLGAPSLKNGNSPAPGEPSHVLISGGDAFSLWFTEEKLTAYEHSSVEKFEQPTTKVDLCPAGR